MAKNKVPPPEYVQDLKTIRNFAYQISNNIVADGNMPRALQIDMLKALCKVVHDITEKWKCTI